MRYVHNGPTRPDWQNVLRRQGLTYIMTTSPESGQRYSYWMESGHFVFNNSETDVIGAANAALWQAYIEAGEKMLGFERAWHGEPGHERDCYFRKLGIPDWAIPAIMRTWQLDEPNGSRCRTEETEHWPCIYGRYDFSVQLDAFGNIVGVKLLEFNSDTPTSLLESAIQWDWFVALHQREGRDQWNSLRLEHPDDEVLHPGQGTDNLVDRWVYELSEYARKWGSLPAVIHVTYDAAEEEGEDYFTCVEMYEALIRASYKMGRDASSAFAVKLIPLHTINRVQPEGCPTVPDGPMAGTPIGHFEDADGVRIKMIFKLNAWEHMLAAADDWGKTALHDMLSDDPTIWIEPPYKLLWSNKGFLAVLWEFFKDDPRFNQYLLPAYFADAPNIPAEVRNNCVKKPIFSREGANAIVIENGIVVEQGPNHGYGDEGYVVQQLAPLPTFQDPQLGTLHAVIGSWMLGDTGAGMCIRVSQGRITNNLSRFAPHYLEMGV